MADPVRQKSQPCRYCGRALDPADPVHAQFWPFCAERCCMAELGLWFQERYVISRPLEEVADDASPEEAGGAEAGGRANAGRNRRRRPGE